MKIPAGLYEKLHPIMLQRNAAIDTVELPGEAQAWIDSVIVKLSYSQDWCGPGAALMEGHWRGLLAELYFLHRMGEIEIPLEELVGDAPIVKSLPA